MYFTNEIKYCSRNNLTPVFILNCVHEKTITSSGRTTISARAHSQENFLRSKSH